MMQKRPKLPTVSNRTVKVTIEMTTEEVSDMEMEEMQGSELFQENTDDEVLVNVPPPYPPQIYHTFLTPVYSRYPVHFYPSYPPTGYYYYY